MKKILLSLGLLALMPSINFGQAISIAPEVGVSFNKQFQTLNGIERSTLIQPGLLVGAIVDFQLTTKFSIAPGLMFSVNNGTESSNERYYSSGSGFPTKETDIRNYNLTYGHMPVFFVFKTRNVYDDPHFIFGIGPSANFLIGGNYRQEYTRSLNGNDRKTIKDGPINIGNDGKTDNIRFFDVWANAFAGFNTGNGLYFKVNYSLGLLNVAPDGSDINHIRNMGFGLSIGYNFKLRSSNPWD